MQTTLEEHLGYIGDTRRTALFRQALSQAIRPGDVVADIGCGFGILGLLCLRVGAARVYGIDKTEAIEIARQTMDRAGLGKRYHCVRERSFRATLPEPADVIVCDHVGNFGVDYGIIEAVADARRRMLKPGGRVFPGRIDLKLAGVASDRSRQLVEAWASAGIPPEYRWLREYGINSKHAHTFSPDEICTRAVSLGTIDLNRDSPDILSFKAVLNVTRDCRIDGLAGWFDCELAENVWMTNSPLDENRIDRRQILLAFDSPLAVAKGASIEVSLAIRHDSKLINWQVRCPETGRMQKHSTWRSMILTERDQSVHSMQVPRLSTVGQARKIVLNLVDGIRSAAEIELAARRHQPQLLPSSEEIGRFVNNELAGSTEA